VARYKNSVQPASPSESRRARLDSASSRGGSPNLFGGNGVSIKAKKGWDLASEFLTLDFVLLITREVRCFVSF